VDVAFVISGFIMWYVLLRTQLSPLQFLWRRILRIVPLYWGVTSVMVLTMMAAPALLQSARFDINHVLASYVFLAWPNPVPGAALRPVLQPGWTLDLEMFFYLLVAIGLLLPRNRQQLFTGVMLAGLAAVGLCVPPGRPIAAFYANSLLIEFALGLGVALLMQHVDWLPKPVYFALIAIGLAGMVGFGNHINQAESNRLVVFGAPVAALGAGMVLFERDHGIGNSRLLKTAGDASYSIYLTHTLFISGFAQLWKRAHLAGTQPWLFVCLAALGSLLLGVLVNRLVERPLIAGFDLTATDARSTIEGAATIFAITTAGAGASAPSWPGITPIVPSPRVRPGWFRGLPPRCALQAAVPASRR
jgi:exopolysaccharide production protein ExoZ